MELVKNIFFNTDKIVENTEIKITYAGALFQNGSSEVIIHLGFGDDWNNAQDIAMDKTELGFQANVNIIEDTKLNFCFKNANNEWDNNGGQNYQFAIEKQEIEEEDIEVEKQAEDAPLAVYKTPSWGELFKKTFSNLVSYFSKIFSKNTENANNDNNE
ncbi:MAG: hypothetical protein IKE91_00690 [Clostridia bacterium]|nr:hypothetical protein [Clostridia bacterium]